jgi:hypothetical protein
MTSHREVEWPEPVAGEGVGTALQNNCARLVPVDDVLHGRLEHGFVRLVSDTVSQRNIHSVPCLISSGRYAQIHGDLPLSFANPIIPHLACTREEFAILVETDTHDPICGIESLLHPIPMMHIDIDVEDSLVISQQLQDAKNDICKSAVCLVSNSPLT